jgi:crotonobetainyl-CoA:carnitine CoA-transferase CaiB-like acyl-CoA transferase
VTLPLAGIKVVEIGQALAGPLAGVIMADMGADVIKVEKPDGGDDARAWGPPFFQDVSLMFRAFNRNKRSIALDIKAPADVARLKSLVAEADIVIQNLRPGIVDELGIGPKDLMAVNPRLIYCSIWAFGHRGALRNNPGFDPLLQAYGGVMTLTGRPEDPPTFCAPAINDKATGMWCVIGALGALQQRLVTGRGCVVDTSLFESATAWVEGQLNGYMLTGTVAPRHGTGSANIVPYQVFETQTKPICIACGNDRLFAKFAREAGRPDWMEDARFATSRQRQVHRTDLIPQITVIMLTDTRESWVARLEKAGVPCAPLNDIGDLAASPQLEAMDLIRTLPDTGVKVVGLPISFDGERPQPYRDAPSVGQHNDEVFPAAKAAE